MPTLAPPPLLRTLLLPLLALTQHIGSSLAAPCDSLEVSAYYNPSHLLSHSSDVSHSPLPVSQLGADGSFVTECWPAASEWHESVFISSSDRYFDDDSRCILNIIRENGVQFYPFWREIPPC